MREEIRRPARQQGQVHTGLLLAIVLLALLIGAGLIYRLVWSGDDGGGVEGSAGSGPPAVGDGSGGDPAMGDPAMGDPAVEDPSVGDRAARAPSVGALSREDPAVIGPAVGGRSVDDASRANPAAGNAAPGNTAPFADLPASGDESPAGTHRAGSGLSPRTGALLDERGTQPPSVQGAISTSRRTAIVEAAERVGDAVVSISVTQVRLVRESVFGGGRDPFESYFSRFFSYPRPERISSIGSGVIIDSRGIVVTNEHVVRDAQEINVTLPDGRTYEANLVGADRAYDLAVLRIDGENLPVVEVGTSADLMVGEWAIGLGNPFGFLLNDYQPTVSVGVVSATQRDVKPDGDTQAIYKDMIQTDAAINPGNSGGPLVNASGQVIGINTFIFSTGGGSLGIGFAIPIDTVIRVTREILEYGRVRQVWIGIRVQEITRLVASYFGIRDTRGLLVWGIEEGSPAALAGIEVGDIIREVNGVPVDRASQAQRKIFGATIGDTITLALERDGERWEAELLLIENPNRP